MPDIGLIIVDPGHFHAALVQQEMYANVAPRVHVYAPLGPELLDYLNRIAGFNKRDERPTAGRSNCTPLPISSPGCRASVPATS